MSHGVRILNRQHVPLGNPDFEDLSLGDILREVKRRYPQVKPEDAWVHKAAFGQWEFHYKTFYWNGKAEGARHAREKGWRAWLNRQTIGNPPYRRRGGSSSGYSSLPAVYSPRFVPRHLMAELSNLWHLSRVPHQGRYERMLWTSREFHKEHPELSETAIYKDLSASLEGWA